MKSLVEQLLQKWCDALLSLQINAPLNKSTDGAIYCPACQSIHGRCFEAMYPFLYMAKVNKDDKWIIAAQKLFSWAETNLSQKDGSFINDKTCDWKGTTVFNVIQLSDCIMHHGNILSESFKNDILNRLEVAANFLYTCEEINENNINYPISNALALHQCGIIFHNDKFIKKAAELAALAQQHISENSLIFGEGSPRNKKSVRGCLPIDIGYNVEETLPSLAFYAFISNNQNAMKLAEKGLLAQLDFMAENGAWDNSFGTRNFKWTYWGSRTSDGCALGYLLFAKQYPMFALAAQKNIELMNDCSIDGLLAGGPHYAYANQLPCVHHTFTHAKVLAAILDKELCCEVSDCKLPRQNNSGVKHYPEIDSYLINLKSMTATVTAYDWEYLKGGHVSGGTLSFWHHNACGTLLCAGMAEYSLHEPHNMQAPDKVQHNCLALRVEHEIDNCLYSSVYEKDAKISVVGNTISASGFLKNIRGEYDENQKISYAFIYEWEENKLTIKAQFTEGTLICPLISHSEEQIDTESNNQNITIIKDKATVHTQASVPISLPYKKERIFNLVPGLQALQTEMTPLNGAITLTIMVKQNRQPHTYNTIIV